MMENVSLREVFESLVGKAKSLKSEVKVSESTFLTCIFFSSVALCQRVALKFYFQVFTYIFEVAVSERLPLRKK